MGTFNNESVEHTGYWWLPSDPEMRIPGRLRFSLQEGVFLDLSGNFDHELVRDPRGVNILGQSSFGEPITIYQAYFQSGESPGGDPTGGKSSFVATRAFIGVHFSQKEDAKFKAIEFQVPYLDRWLNLPILDYKHRERGFSLTYERPELISFNPSDELKIKINFEASGPAIGSTVTDISFTHRAVFIVELSDTAHFNDFGEILVHLTNFLALAVVAPVRPVAVYGWVPATGSDEVSERTTGVDVLLPIYTPPQEDDISTYDMLFTYSDIKERFGVFLENWFRKRDLLQPVFDLFFSAIYDTNPHAVTTFLNYTQAIETYHIRTMTKKVEPPEEYTERVREILASVPEEHREWVRKRLAFRKRPTLAQRLKDVIDFYPFPVTGQRGSHEVFIREVKDTRNYYTHYDPSLEEKAPQRGYLKGLSITLGSLLEGLLLHELGFGLDEVKEMQQKRRRRPSFWFWQE
jgi:hypothetical protein